MAYIFTTCQVRCAAWADSRLELSSLRSFMHAFAMRLEMSVDTEHHISFTLKESEAGHALQELGMREAKDVQPAGDWFAAEVNVPQDVAVLNFVVQYYEHFDNNYGQDFKAAVQFDAEGRSVSPSHPCVYDRLLSYNLLKSSLRHRLVLVTLRSGAPAIPCVATLSASHMCASAVQCYLVCCSAHFVCVVGYDPRRRA